MKYVLYLVNNNPNSTIFINHLFLLTSNASNVAHLQHFRFLNHFIFYIGIPALQNTIIIFTSRKLRYSKYMYLSFFFLQKRYNTNMDGVKR